MSECFRHPDPLDDDTSDNIAITATVVFGVATILTLIIRTVYMRTRGLKLMPYFWPVRREVGLRAVGLSPTDKVSVLAWDYWGLCIFILLDAWFRSAAFAIPGYELRKRFGSDGWITFFDAGRVDFDSHIAWILLFSVVAFLGVVCSLMLRATRYDILYNADMPVPGKLKTWLRVGYTIIRLNEGYIMAIAFLFMDPWVCDFARVDPGTLETTFYVTGDCDSALECHTGKYYVAMVFAALLLFVLFLNFVLPTRSPVARWSLYACGIPHLSPGTIFLRVFLSWSAKVMTHWDLCASLYTSGISNFLITICFALALDSRRLYMPMAVFALAVLAEIWIHFYAFANIIAYGTDGNGLCVLFLLLILFFLLMYLLVVLTLRQRNANQDKAYLAEQAELEAAKERAKGNPASAQMRDPEVVFVAGVEDKKRFTYQWKLNGRNLNGQVYSTCIVPQSHLEPEALVCVKLNRRDGEQFPVMTVQPQAVATEPGKTVTLRTAVADPHGCTYQWYMDGKPVPGATGPTLTFPASDENLGTYQCVVTNDIGNTTNSKAAPVDYTEDEWERRRRAEADRAQRDALEAEARRREDEEAERRRIADLERQKREADEEERRRRQALLDEEERKRREAEEAARRAREEEEARAKAAEDAAMAAMMAEAEAQAQYEMDRSQTVEPVTVGKVDYAEIVLNWDDPPVSDPSQLVYRVTVGEWDDDPSDDDPPQVFIMRPNGSPNKFVFDSFHGEPIEPGEGFQFNVEYALLDDMEDDAKRAAAAGAGAPGDKLPPTPTRAGAGSRPSRSRPSSGAPRRGGSASSMPTSPHRNLPPGAVPGEDPRFSDLPWYGAGVESTKTETRVPEAPVALLSGRFPRIWMLKPFEFETNKALLNPGSLALLPDVVAVCNDVDKGGQYRVMVEGHVNFGQPSEAAQKLSERRANTIRRKLLDQGLDESTLVTSGYGWRFPRFPRGSKLTRKNRRVEFRLFDPAVDDGLRK